MPAGRARGFCLSRFASAARTQTKTSLRLSSPDAHKAVCLLGHKNLGYPQGITQILLCPPRDLVTSPLVDPRGSRPRLAMLAFRPRSAGPQTRIRLRLSSPVVHQAVGALWTKF